MAAPGPLPQLTLPDSMYADACFAGLAGKGLAYPQASAPNGLQPLGDPPRPILADYNPWWAARLAYACGLAIAQQAPNPYNPALSADLVYIYAACQVAKEHIRRFSTPKLVKDNVGGFDDNPVPTQELLDWADEVWMLALVQGDNSMCEKPGFSFAPARPGDWAAPPAYINDAINSIAQAIATGAAPGPIAPWTPPV